VIGQARQLGAARVSQRQRAALIVGEDVDAQFVAAQVKTDRARARTCPYGRVPSELAPPQPASNRRRLYAAPSAGASANQPLWPRHAMRTKRSAIRLTASGVHTSVPG
jgi:hypothetical protein